MLDELEAISDGRNDRLMVFMPPGSAKSTYGSMLFPPWYLSRHPDHMVIAASHTHELAARWGRKCRNLVLGHSNSLGVALADGDSAADRWSLSSGGEYFAAGVGGSVTGRRADLVVIDDPVRSREDADSETIRDKTLDWFRSDLLTRLKPGGRIVVIQCMTGDTQVMMADGSLKHLRDVRKGDSVSTYNKGQLKTSVVLNWVNNGPDRVYAIKTKSGITVKANERHPFLVYEDGNEKWIRTRDLRPGHAIFRARRESGRARPALGTDVTSPSEVADTACRTTTRNVGQTAFGHLRPIACRAAKRISGIATGFRLPIITEWQRSKTAAAQFASSLQAKMSALIGAGSFASITATTPMSFAGFSATTATLRLDTPEQRTQPLPSLNISDFTLDDIIAIEPAGVEDVFDVQIEGTENFIANGLVSHNTRWHEADLSGELLEAMKKGGDQWRVISLPALAGPNDPLGRKPGEALWPEWEDEAALKRKRAMLLPREWSALYQQNPVPDDGDYFKADWIKRYSVPPDPAQMRIVGASDYAVTADGGDYTVHIVVGMDTERRPYVLDLWREQTSSEQWIDAWCDLVRYWKPIEWGEEKGQIASGVGPFLQRRALEKQAYTFRRQFASRTDKAIRAQSIRGRMAQLGLYIPQDAPWAADFIAELLQFPAGKHDDQVDALGLVGQLLDHIDAGFKPKSKEPDHRRGPVYVAGPDGRVTANIDLLKHLEAKRRKREEV